MKRWQASLLLVIAVAIWGSTFLIVHETARSFPPLALISARFLIGALFVVPFAVPTLQTFRVKDWKAGVILGSTLLFAFISQTYGLTLTPPARAGFLTGMNVVFVPLLGILLFREIVQKSTWVGIFLAILGLFVLTSQKTNLGSSLIGDLLVLICAVSLAGHVVAVGRVGKSVSIGLNAVQLLFPGVVIAVLSLLIEGVPPWPSPTVLLAIFYLGGIATALVLAIQLAVQKVLSPTHTALIFILEPVFGAFFSFLFGNEELTVIFALGGGLMLGGIALSELSIRPIQKKR